MMYPKSLFQVSCVAYLTLVVEAESTARPSLSYTALGDSYAAGDGAGSSTLLPDFDVLCARFSDAYPVKIADSALLDVTDFRSLACGGAFTTSVLRTQIPRIAGSDVVTIQVGGNEIDFFLILNECVQQWQPISNCDVEINRARQLVQSTAFMTRFDDMIAGAKKMLEHDSHLLVLGYARFFNERTQQCDHVSFSKTDPTRFLNRQLRREMNEILVLLNQVIQGTAEGHGATYVDTDKVFEGHRFCEEGISEPAPDQSWFFNDAGREASRASHSENAMEQQHVLTNPIEGFVNLTKTFHPTSEGHQGIAAEVVRTIGNLYSK